MGRKNYFGMADFESHRPVDDGAYGRAVGGQASDLRALACDLDEKLEELMHRITRMETRQCRLMAHMGLDPWHMTDEERAMRAKWEEKND